MFYLLRDGNQSAPRAKQFCQEESMKNRDERCKDPAGQYKGRKSELLTCN